MTAHSMTVPSTPAAPTVYKYRPRGGWLLHASTLIENEGFYSVRVLCRSDVGRVSYVGRPYFMDQPWALWGNNMSGEVCPTCQRKAAALLNRAG